MKRLSATARIALGLSCLTVSVLLAAQTCGLIPDHRVPVTKGRAALCEAMAINFSLLASRGDLKRIDVGLQAIVKRNRDILSAAVRRADGKYLVEVGEHATQWNQSADGRSTDSNIYVPIAAGDRRWGTVEVRFRPMTEPGLAGILQSPLFRLTAFIAVVGFLTQFFYLRKMLQHMDPSKVVPDRVRDTLDTLAEGLLVMDQNGRIVLANKAFSETVGRSASQLQGCQASELPWLRHENAESDGMYPWTRAIQAGVTQTGVMLDLKAGASEKKTFIVNSAPILGDDGQHRGVLASFDDVTHLEQKKADLSRTLDMLKKSSDEISRQNRELEVLATQDPLTSCLNRRSFFDQFDTHWNTAERYGHALSLAMVDIDHFKSVNDDHGHSVGDTVLKQVANVLKTSARDCDLVCRFGGEEFCILMPNTNLDAAYQAADRFRAAIEGQKFENLSVTASLGVSEMALGASSPQLLLDEADKCLYVAKRNGRNQVVRWDNVPDDLEVDESQVSRTVPAVDPDAAVSVPYHAVTALISALAYRDLSTAEHSRRVADYCVAAAAGVMSLSESYVLEMAALLHDIGKVGVPDSILLKPGPLTKDEWIVMQAHDRIGVEIIRAAFASPELTTIVESHHAFFGDGTRKSGLPTGLDIPLGARILSIADAYDAMVSDRVYRKGRTTEQAFAELRRCAGSQFDPELVERFIQSVNAQSTKPNTALSTVSKETALSIGLQIERLSSALDDRDLNGLKIMANRLNTVATKQGVSEIAERAAQLEQSVTDDLALMEIVGSANELLDLCRCTQKSYLHGWETDRLAEVTESA